MIVADARLCSEYLKTFGKTTSRQMGRLIKKYVDYFSDYEKRYRKFSQKELDRVIKYLQEYEGEIKGKPYIDVKDKLPMLLKYKAKEQIYLQLKNK